MHISTKDLPRSLQSALSALGYHKADISVKAAEKFSVIDYGGAGRRAFACMVNLATGESQTMHGSWGGANAFAPTNHVDLDSTKRPLPDGFALIQGSEGNGPVYASVSVNPRNLSALLPEGASDELTEKEKGALRLFSYISSARKEYAKGMGVEFSASHPLFASLIQRGYIKANKAGAMQLTTKGKNHR